MSVLKYQSDDEVVRVLTEWGTHFFPPTVVKNSRNMTLIGNRCLAESGEIVSIVGLTEAANALAAAGQLDLIPQPKQLTEVEKAKRGNEIMRKSYLDSLAPQKTLVQEKMGQDRLAQNAKDEVAREHKATLALIEREVNSHVCGHASGRPDFSKTDSEKQTLREVRDKFSRNTLENAKSCLSAVRAKKATL